MRLLFFAIITMTGNVYGSIIRNTRKKPLFSRLQSKNGITTPPLPLNAFVAQRGASVGIPHKYYWQRKSGGGDKKSSLLGRQASQTAFRLPLKTGEPVPLFGLQEKGWRHLRPPFHIGRAVPAGISELTVFAN